MSNSLLDKIVMPTIDVLQHTFYLCTLALKTQTFISKMTSLGLSKSRNTVKVFDQDSRSILCIHLLFTHYIQNTKQVLKCWKNVEGWAYLHYNYKFTSTWSLRMSLYSDCTAGKKLSKWNLLMRAEPGLWQKGREKGRKTFGSSVRCLLSPKTHWLLI